MDFVGRISVDQVVEAFREDHLVLALGRAWPSTPVDRIKVLHDAGRPVDNILKMAWSLYTIDKAEALRTLHLTVWSPAVYLGEMINAFQTGTTPVPPEVAKLESSWRAGGFSPDRFKLIGYDVGGSRIQLEDGYNSSTAAGLAGVLPATIHICLGEFPISPVGV